MRALYSGLEMNVFLKSIFIADEVQISFCLWLRSEMLRPIPLVKNLKRTDQKFSLYQNCEMLLEIQDSISHGYNQRLTSAQLNP